MREQTGQSSGTRSRMRRRVQQLLVAEHGVEAPALPARSTFYRLVDRVARGRHTFGSARTRRSLAKQPDRMHGTVIALRPGELVEIDSTPLDVRVVLDNGTVDRVELTGMVDIATRTLAAAVLRPTTKAVDAALLLARALTPEPMRPGWSDALRMARSVLPHHRLVPLDQRLEQAAARPVIVPETIVCDHGKAFMSRTFRSACRALGTNVQPTHPGTPTDNAVAERTLQSVGTLFAQHVAGYVGSSVERRGEKAERAAVWSMAELQDLLDEWVVGCWQNRPHDGLRHPLTPGQRLTPNEQYAALVEIAGYVPVALASDDYIELLPVEWRAITPAGIKINHRVYDCPELVPYRRQHSGVDRHKGLWEVHHDPYDVTRIWVRNHHDSGWITVPWKHLRTAPAPFGEAAWSHGRRLAARRGTDPVTERQIAEAVDTLLDTAGRGPDNRQPRARRDARIAGRTRASAPIWPAPAPTGSSPTETPANAEGDVERQGNDSERVAKVVPLGIYDAREEAKKWW
ncbi:Mu transposase C-terminal domain-containing protein [Nonomuraea longicatena]|uniref:Mu transposase C-terminal domain-containing protein n=1 Tax=Nonomuraea longicatena TaxID=83682 RepID=UPI0031D3F308